MKNWCLLSNDPSHTVCLELIWGWFLILHLFFECAEIFQFQRRSVSWSHFNILGDFIGLLTYTYTLLFAFPFQLFDLSTRLSTWKTLFATEGSSIWIYVELSHVLLHFSGRTAPVATGIVLATRVLCTQNVSPDSETWRMWSSWLQRDHMLVLGFPPAVEDTLVSRLPMRVFWGFLWLIFSLFSFSFFVFSLTTFSPYTLPSGMTDEG